ncbi:MAG TPA: spermidine/putrescine ABC transporter substrate-binding protein [Bryobacteraceae bacterium]|nr:spermidine/putrescine ABC transporter substrate-binding protein [Bryobacteraceae bacterium]
MNRRGFLVSAAGAAGCARSGARLNVFNWSNYVAPDTIPNFQRETGVRVRYAVYESNEEMLARVFSGNSGWDVVFPTHYFIGPMREQGLLARLSRERLPNLRSLDAGFQSPAWDRGLEWSAPYMWSGTGIAYNRKVAPAPSSWAALWDTRLEGRITMLDDPAEVLGASLKKLGLSVNSTDPVELRRAQGEAIRQKPLVRAYLNAEVRDQLAAGDVLAAQLWGTTAQQAMDASEDLAFVYPSEGFPLYADCAVILRESRRADLAHRFIDYLLRPEVSASISKASRTAACARVPEQLRRNPVLYPPPEALACGEWWQTPPPSLQRLRDRLWTEIKSA